MANHSRTIQIRIYDEENPQPSMNKALVPAWRVQPGDHVWFVRCSGTVVKEKAVFTRQSPFVSQKLEVPFEMMPSKGAPANEEVIGDQGGSYEFYVQSNPSGLLKGQIDIDP
jgi:hypothetical protein